METDRRAALHNLGCKVNAYETEAMGQLLKEAGYTIVPFTERADVYVVNTCSVTNIADRKSRQMLHRARKQNPDAVIVAAGCYAQTRGEEAFLDPAVDLVVGNNQKSRLVELLEDCFALRERGAGGKARPAVVDINDRAQPFEAMELSCPAGHTRAFLKVQDGCDQFCSYCIIPYARGRARSRKMDEVAAQVEQLAQNGVREVVLTGIHLSSYGLDTGESLLALIQRVHGVEGITRIRLGSLEPKVVTEEFVRGLAALPKLCPHFHLSLQSGCDATLARMNRHYTTEEYGERCALLRRYFAHPAITTDVIAGFPGETEAEFAETVEFLRRIHFYEMHIFKYSRRQGTRAAAMEGQVSEEQKAARSAVLLGLAERMSREFREYYEGRGARVLFEEQQSIEGRLMWTGYTPEYVKAACPSPVSLENREASGRLGRLVNGEIFVMDFAPCVTNS